jgi:hypothetical protein
MLFTRWLVAAPLLALASHSGSAQEASAPALRPDPLNADAVVPTVSAPRTFERYQAYRDAGPAPWRDTNAAVAPKPGADAHDGHAGHAMPASAPPAAPAPPAHGSMPGTHHH